MGEVMKKAAAARNATAAARSSARHAAATVVCRPNGWRRPVTTSDHLHGRGAGKFARLVKEAAANRACVAEGNVKLFRAMSGLSYAMSR
jgi:hypothetical protein